MEVLLVLAILGVIMSMVVPKILGRQKHANEDATRLSLQGLKQALKMYDAYDVDGREYRELAESLGMNTGELNQACWQIRRITPRKPQSNPSPSGR